MYCLVPTSNVVLTQLLQGSCQRCFKGHNGPVSTLSDKLLGYENSKVLASGGEDGTVRLWSLSSNGKRGQHTPKATLYGHLKPVKLMTVAEYVSLSLYCSYMEIKIRRILLALLLHRTIIDKTGIRSL